MTPPPETGPGLKKALSSLDAYAMGFGAMIGFGWVVLVGGWLKNAGTLGSIIAIVSGGLIMTVVALVYAELIAAIPKAGGEHHFLLRGMGARWSFLGSWGITGGYISIVAFEAVALPRTAAYIWPEIESIPLWNAFGSDVYIVWALVGAGAAVVITWINYIGVKLAGIVQTIVVATLLVIGALLVFGAGTGGSVANFEPLFTDARGLFTVMIVVPFLFVGFDVIPQSADAISSRVTAARRHLLQNGRLPGGSLPYGWRALPDPDGVGKVLTQDPERIEYVRGAADRVRGGATLYSVVQWLDEVGAPLPRPSDSRRKGTGWSYSTVNRLMQNPGLAGMVPYNPGNVTKERGSDVLRDERGLPVVDPPLRS